jgi:hypothetical protein
MCFFSALCLFNNVFSTVFDEGMFVHDEFRRILKRASVTYIKAVFQTRSHEVNVTLSSKR